MLCSAIKYYDKELSRIMFEGKSKWGKHNNDNENDVDHYRDRLMFY